MFTCSYESSNKRKKIKYISLDEALREWNLHHYILESTNIEHIPKAYVIAYNYKKIFSYINDDRDSILVTGPKGVGKTLTSIAVWVKLQYLGVATLFTSVFTLKRLEYVPILEYNDVLL